MRLKVVRTLFLLLSALPVAAQSIATSKSEYVVGEHVAVSFDGSTSQLDWVGIFPAGAPHAPSSIYWQYTNGAMSGTGPVIPTGTLRFLPFSIPQGDYDVRLYADDGFIELASTTIKVVSGAASPAPPPAGDLTVMTFNIWRSSAGLDEQNVVDAIAKAGADVIALQEVDNAAQLQRLANLLRAKPGYGGLQLSTAADVLSRFPIVGTYTAGLAGYGVKIEVSPGSYIRFFNTHLTHVGYGPYLARDGSTAAQVLASEGSTRVPQINAILSGLINAPSMEPELPTFLAGDLNCPSHLDWTAANSTQNFGLSLEWPVSKALEDAGFQDLYREVHSDPSQERGFTWSPGYPKGTLDLNEVHDRIDMIFFRPDSSPRYQAVQAYTFDADPWPSDHAAVVASVAAITMCPVFAAAMGTPHGSGGWNGPNAKMADVNGDGRTDYVYTGDLDLWVRLSNGDGTFQAVVQAPHGSAGWNGPDAKMADVNGDGRADFVYTGDTDLWVRLSNGDGTFQAVVQNLHGSAGWGSSNARMTDVNGDGRADYVFTGNTDLWVRLANDDGTFQTVVQDPHGSSGWAGPDAKMADVNGDGRTDYVFTGNTDLWVRLANDDGTFQAAVQDSHGSSGWSGSDARMVDVNGNGRSDFVYTGHLDVWVRLSNGDGTFQAVVQDPHGSPYWSGVNARMADVNGDGRADYVNTDDADLWVRLSNGDGTFQTVVQDPHGSAGWAGPDAKMADVNGDGRTDFVFTGDTDLTVRLSAAAAALPYGTGKAGTLGIPSLFTLVVPALGATSDLTVANGNPGDTPVLLLGQTQISLPFDGGTLLVQPLVTLPMLPFNAARASSLQLTIPTGSPCANLFWQAIFVDNGGGATGALQTAQTNGLQWSIGG